MRWVPCWYGCAAVNRADAGSIPATAALRKGKPIGDGTPFEAGRALLPCGFDSRSFRLHSTCPWPIGLGTSLPSWTGGFDSRRALCISGDGLTVRFLALNQAMGVRFPLPEPRYTAWHAAADRVIDQLLRGRLTVGRDALNVLVLVRFQPPQLTDGSHPAG